MFIKWFFKVRKFPIVSKGTSKTESVYKTGPALCLMKELGRPFKDVFWLIFLTPMFFYMAILYIVEAYSFYKENGDDIFEGSERWNSAFFGLCHGWKLKTVIDILKGNEDPK